MRRLKVGSLVVLVALTGCFSFDHRNILHVQTGYRAATVTIKRHASRDLVTQSIDGRTDRAKGEKAAGLLRTAAAQAALSGFLAARWNAATAPDQYTDIGEDIRRMYGHSRCLAVRAKVGWASIGYDWFTYVFGEAGCDWGFDPDPKSP